jgi:hypothetical protein
MTGLMTSLPLECTVIGSVLLLVRRVFGKENVAWISVVELETLLGLSSNSILMQ